MNRSAKKFLYALLYLGVFSFFAFVIFLIGRLGEGNTSSLSLAPLPSRENALQVQETQVFRLRDAPGSFVFGRIKNSSSDSGFRFSYSFLLHDASDKLLRKIMNEVSVSPSSDTLVSEIVQDVPSRDVYRVSLEMENIEEAPAYEFPVTSFSFVSEPSIEILDTERVIRVFGTLRNESGTFFPAARAVALLRDEFGFQVFATETKLLNIRSFSEKNFEIPVPYDLDLARQLMEGSAEVYVYPIF